MGCTNSKQAVEEFTVRAGPDAPGQSRANGSTKQDIEVEASGSPASAASTAKRQSEASGKSIKSAPATESGTTVSAAPTSNSNTNASTATAKSETSSNGGGSQLSAQKKTPVPRPKDSSATLSKAHTVVIKKGFEVDYELGDKLGEGNYAIVYHATRRSTGEKFAVKVTERGHLEESDIRDIREEVSILMELGHSNIIKVFDYYEEEEFIFIVTELMAGGELFDEILEREFYWERDAQEVIKMLAGALNYMHKRGIVHRDLKPENVLLTSKGKDGTAKLADFGFAARTDLGKSESQLWTPCGTPGYVAPEILKGVKYGREVDIWSLGVIAFIMLGGYPPFHDDNQQKLFAKIRKGDFSFDPNYWSMISEEAKDCIRGMLTTDPKKRLTAEGVLEHPWLATVPETAEEGNTFGGIGGRGQGLEGRGLEGSVSINISPNLKELHKFQARRRWKDTMAIALAREGKIFGNNTLVSLIEETPVQVHREDISKMPGLGQSDILVFLQTEKRKQKIGIPTL